MNCFICLLLLSVFGKERNFHLRLLADEDPSWLISHVDVVIVASHQDKHRPGPRLIEPIYFSTHCSVKYLSKKSFIFFVFFHSSDPSSGSMWNSEHFRASWLHWDLPDLNSFYSHSWRCLEEPLRHKSCLFTDYASFVFSHRLATQISMSVLSQDFWQISLALLSRRATVPRAKWCNARSSSSHFLSNPRKPRRTKA